MAQVSRNLGQKIKKKRDYKQVATIYEYPNCKNIQISLKQENADFIMI